MTSEQILAIVAGLQVAGIVVTAALNAKWKNDILTAMASVKDWADGRFATKEMCNQRHNESLRIFGEVKRTKTAGGG